MNIPISGFVCLLYSLIVFFMASAIGLIIIVFGGFAAVLEILINVKLT